MTLAAWFLSNTSLRDDDILTNRLRWATWFRFCTSVDSMCIEAGCDEFSINSNLAIFSPPLPVHTLMKSNHERELGGCGSHRPRGPLLAPSLESLHSSCWSSDMPEGARRSMPPKWPQSEVAVRSLNTEGTDYGRVRILTSVPKLFCLLCGLHMQHQLLTLLSGLTSPAI